jgi:hypothetical protein
MPVMPVMPAKVTMGKVVAGLMLVIGVCFILVWQNRVKREGFEEKKTSCGVKVGACRTTPTYGELDEVNNPEYNVQEVIKNTLLIEQHLSEKNKYCKTCLVKHFLLSQALISEAIWMAQDKVGKYPKLEESCGFYNDVFKKWKDNMDDDTTRLETLNQLREWRQKMIDLYYFAADVKKQK